jgi:hypothetical protein
VNLTSAYSSVAIMCKIVPLEELFIETEARDGISETFLLDFPWEILRL